MNTAIVTMFTRGMNEDFENSLTENNMRITSEKSEDGITTIELEYDNSYGKFSMNDAMFMIQMEHPAILTVKYR